jgi:hypothetical protein
VQSVNKQLTSGGSREEPERDCGPSTLDFSCDEETHSALNSCIRQVNPAKQQVWPVHRKWWTVLMVRRWLRVACASCQWPSVTNSASLKDEIKGAVLPSMYQRRVCHSQGTVNGLFGFQRHIALGLLLRLVLGILVSRALHTSWLAERRDEHTPDRR